MAKNDPQLHNRVWARHFGEFIPPTQREFPSSMVEHPLWAVKREFNKELYDELQRIHKIRKRYMPRDRMILINITKPGCATTATFVVQKYTDFADLNIGHLAGESENIERESDPEPPLSWAMMGRNQW